MDIKKCICLDCGDSFEIQNGCLRKRRLRPGEPICPTCYRKMSKGGPVSIHPEELDAIWNQDILDYKTVLPFLDKLKTKKKVQFVCQECGKKDIMPINSMRRRKICGIKPICRKCSLKYATNSEEWINNNSKAQYIAQNRPEVLEKQRNSQFALMAKDPLYADKRCSKSYISGTIKGMRFDSSWELYFIVHCWNSKDIISIERYGKSLTYIDVNGKARRYYPDFIVEYKNNKKKIVEIKGSRKYNNFHDKFNAARKKHGINYVVYEEKDINKMGILFRKERWLMDFYRKYNKYIKFYDNEKTRIMKERIKSWLK